MTIVLYYNYNQCNEYGDGIWGSTVISKESFVGRRKNINKIICVKHH
jgi:hypothetical protein